MNKHTLLSSVTLLAFLLITNAVYATSFDQVRESRNPVYNTEGSKIYFESNIYNFDSSGEINNLFEMNIFSINMETKAIRPITTEGGRNPSVDASDENISYDSGGDIFIFNKPTNTHENITNDEHNNYFPTYSPDGKRIAFVSNKEGKNHIWIYDIETKKIEATTFKNYFYNAVNPEWSKNGNSIFFTGCHLGECKLYNLEISTKIIDLVFDDSYSFTTVVDEENILIHTQSGLKKLNLASKNISEIDGLENIFYEKIGWSEKKDSVVFSKSEKSTMQIFEKIREKEITQLTTATDNDTDLVIDHHDNCPNTSNEDQSNFDNDSMGDACDEDDDNDLIPDVWENENSFNRLDPLDASLDSDNDGLSNLEEFKYETNPHDADTDNDGVLDGVEVAKNSNPLDPNSFPAKSIPTLSRWTILILTLSLALLGFYFSKRIKKNIN